MKIKLAKFISQFLVDNGITDCFMVTGGGAMHLDDAIGHQEGMHCVFNHHEQACSIAAEGYTRMTGKLAAVCVTSGPGGTNAITGVMGGWLDSIPMFNFLLFNIYYTYHIEESVCNDHLLAIIADCNIFLESLISSVMF